MVGRRGDRNEREGGWVRDGRRFKPKSRERVPSGWSSRDSNHDHRLAVVIQRSHRAFRRRVHRWARTINRRAQKCAKSLAAGGEFIQLNKTLDAFQGPAGKWLSSGKYQGKLPSAPLSGRTRSSPLVLARLQKLLAGLQYGLPFLATRW